MGRGGACGGALRAGNRARQAGRDERLAGRLAGRRWNSCRCRWTIPGSATTDRSSCATRGARSPQSVSCFDGWNEQFVPYESRCPRRGAGRLCLGRALLSGAVRARGGAFNTDGEGSLLTTEQCLLHNRNLGMAAARLRGSPARVARYREGDLAALRAGRGLRSAIDRRSRRRRRAVHRARSGARPDGAARQPQPWPAAGEPGRSERGDGCRRSQATRGRAGRAAIRQGRRRRAGPGDTRRHQVDAGSVRRTSSSSTAACCVPRLEVEGEDAAHRAHRRAVAGARGRRPAGRDVRFRRRWTGLHHAAGALGEAGPVSRVGRSAESTERGAGRGT